MKKKKKANKNLLIQEYATFCEPRLLFSKILYPFCNKQKMYPS